jgi:hypothetical protein
MAKTVGHSIGTAIVWGTPSGTIRGQSVTKDLTLDALASGSGRMGVYADLQVTVNSQTMLLRCWSPRRTRRRAISAPEARA